MASSGSALRTQEHVRARLLGALERSAERCEELLAGEPVSVGESSIKLRSSEELLESDEELLRSHRGLLERPEDCESDQRTVRATRSDEEGYLRRYMR